MTRRELVGICLGFPGTYEDYPFDGEWVVMRHSQNKKSFALIYERLGELCVNLKCEPEKADFLRSIYAGVRPAYHMNKTHWNTVVIGSDVPEDELHTMILHSYELIRPKRRKHESV